MDEKHLPWFRMYTEAVDDEKLKLLAFEDRWHFVALLCCKGKGMLDEDQSFDLLERKLSVKLGLQRRELDELHRRLMEVGLVDEYWQPTKWDSRQYRSDRSTERVRRHRQKNQNADVTHETDMKRYETVSVTPPDTETDTDTEKDKKNRPSTCEVDESEFDEAYKALPKRKPSHNRKQAWRAYVARRRAGVSAEEILEGAKRYARHIRSEQKEGSRYVMMAGTFFGPDEHYAQGWEVERPTLLDEHGEEPRWLKAAL